MSASPRMQTISSPDGQVALRVEVDKQTIYSVSYKGQPVLLESPLSMTFDNGVTAGHQMRVNSSKTQMVNEEITSVLPTKNRVIRNEYHQLTLHSSRYDIVFRVYNDGVAYRFVTRFNKPVKVMNEEVIYRFGGDFPMFFGKEESMFTHQERLYLTQKMSAYQPGQFCSMPLMVTTDAHVRVVITESDLEDYGGMYMSVDSLPCTLSGIFAREALETRQTSDRAVQVTRAADYIAEVQGTRTFPWRVMVISDDDTQILASEMVYKLADPSRLDDPSWIKPGKVAWDWWNANNIYGVDFEAGVNTATYKYYIDFASKYGLQYIILDEGWYDIKKNLLSVVPDMNIEELVKYGAERQVGIILWTTWKALEDMEDEALDQFEKWGIKGIKVDFMQRDDRYMVNYYYRIAKKAAEHHLLVDYHGNYKPTGLQRTFPNVISFEGVRGLENMKWENVPDPEHNTTLPFLRMLAGPMDYTPGGMLNYTKESFHFDYDRPGTLGTRCQQLGLYVVFESPLMMLADNPTNYYREPLSMEFLKEVPTVWDETKVLKAQVSDYVVVARRSENRWFVGAITDWTAREFTITADFLDEGKTYRMTSWEDGVNVRRQPTDHAQHTREIRKGDSITLKLASGGGYVAIIE